MAEIRVPTLGESVTEATIGKWFKKPGEAVAVDGGEHLADRRVHHPMRGLRKGGARRGRNGRWRGLGCWCALSPRRCIEAAEQRIAVAAAAGEQETGEHEQSQRVA